MPGDAPEPSRYLDRAVADGLIRIIDTGTGSRVEYPGQRTERWGDPEEKVRAAFFTELVYRYGYEVTNIGLEITVPDRLPSERADIVIFRDAKRTRPYAVIECKRENISDAEFNQAVEQAVGNGTWAKFRADYVMVVAGSTRRVLDFTGAYGVLEREENIVADLPKAYGRPAEFKYLKHGTMELEPAADKQGLIAVLKKCHQSLWGGGRLSPPAAFGELCKLIFVKIQDELAKRREGEPYQFQIKTHETAERLAMRIHALYEAQMAREPNIFKEPIRVDAVTLRAVVSHLEGMDLSSTDLDVKGVAFETFMDGFFKGDFGQYFTPRQVIEFAIEVLEPTNESMILDPACGSSGFLLYALDRVREEAAEYHAPMTPAFENHWRDFSRSNLYGIEVSEEIARVAMMNMVLHGDGHTNIVSADSLKSFDVLGDINGGLRPNSFDIVLSNPPFGAQVVFAERPYLVS